MKKLDLKRMEVIQGGKLTEEEVTAFLGTVACISSLFGSVFSMFACAAYIYYG